MRDNRIGFDILENSGLDKIEEMGADSPMISKRSRNRMLEMSRRKYEEAKAAAGEPLPYTNNDSETLEMTVEEYNKPRIKRTVMTAISCAAAFALIGGSVLLLGKRNNDLPAVTDSDITLNSPTTSTSDDAEETTTASDSTETGTNTAKTTTRTVTVTTPGGTTLPSSGNNNGITAESPSVNNDDNVIPVNGSGTEAAAQRALDAFVHSDIQAGNINYKFIDMNSDGTPELMINCEHAYYGTLLYSYNGSEYVSFKDANGQDYIITSTTIPAVSLDEKCVYLWDKESGGVGIYITMDSDNTFKAETFYQSYDLEDAAAHSGDSNYSPKEVYYHNSNIVSRDEFNSYLAPYNSYNFAEVNDFNFYAAETDGRIRQNEQWATMEEAQAEYDRQHPHNYDYANINIDMRWLVENGIFDANTSYAIEHTDTYCDGTTSNQYMGSTGFNDPYIDGETLILNVHYGDNDYAPCHVVVTYTSDGKNSYPLFEADIDFKNRTYTFSNDLAYNYAYLWFDCPSDYNAD